MAKTIKKHSRTVLILGFLILGVALYFAVPTLAGSCTWESDTLSNSGQASSSDHLIYFLTPTGVDASGDTIVIEWATAWSMAGLTIDDVDFATSTVTTDCNTNATWYDVTLAGTAASGVWGWSTTTGATLDMEFDAPTDAGSDTITAGTCVKIEIGLNSGGSNQMTNPSTAGVKDIDISGDFGDTGKMKVAIISGVTVTATVAETLSVAVNASTCANLVSGGTNRESATTSINFETVGTSEFFNSCQRIDVTTNAPNGYIATVHKDQPLTYDSYEILDGDCDGACSTTSAAVWAAPADNYGFGYCMKDRDNNGAQVADPFWGTNNCGAGSQFFKVIGNNSGDAEDIMKSSMATSTNRAWIGYRLNVDPLQATGDYTTVIIYIVTPSY